MANEATAELYTKQSGLNKKKLDTDYQQYLEELATKYGISNEQLNTNLESRGILRSGEAGTARTRLSAAEEAARTTAKTNYDYNTAIEDVDLMTKLAALQAGSAGSGGGGGGTGGGSSGGGSGGGSTGGGNTPTPVLYRSPTDPAFDGMRDRGPRTPAPAVRPVRDATPRPAVPATVVNMPRPGTTPAPAPAVTPVYGGGTTQGQLPQAPLPTTPALPDLSGVDWDALARMGNNNKPKPVVYGGGTTQGQLPQAPIAKPKPATTRVNPVAARLR